MKDEFILQNVTRCNILICMGLGMFAFLFRYSLNTKGVSLRGTVQIENDKTISVFENYTRAREKEMS